LFIVGAEREGPLMPPGVRPLSNLAGYLPPLWLSPHLAMRRAD
jgi:hypothetical protein